MGVIRSSSNSDLRVWDTSGETSVDDTVWSARTAPYVRFDASTSGRLAYVDPDGTILVVDIDDGVVDAEIDQNDEVASVVPSPDGTRVAALGNEGALTVFDVATGEVVSGPIRVSGLSHPHFSSDGRLIFVAGASGVDVVDVDAGEVLSSRASLAHVYDAAAQPGSQRAFIATEQGTTMLLDADGQRDRREVVRSFELPGPRRWLEITGEGEIVALGMSDASVIDRDSGAILRQTVGLPWREMAGVRDVNRATAPVTNLTGDLIASPDAEGYSRLWTTATGDELYVAPAGWDIRAVSNAGDRVLIHRMSDGMTDPQSRVVTVATGVEVDIVDAESITRGYFTPDDRHVVLHTGLTPTGIFDVDSGEPAVDFSEYGISLTGHLHMAPGGDRLVIGTNSGELVSLDLPQLLEGASVDEATVFRVQAHATFINPVVVSDDGAFIATIGRGEPVRLWDGETGEPIGSFSVEMEDPGVVFDPIEPLVYLADGDRLTVHTLDVDVLLEAARLDVQRELTAAECERFLDRSC